MNNIAVIGSGYVGLATGVGFAELGWHVRCVDQDEEKINKLSAGEIPFYEPDLHKKMTEHMKNGRLLFNTQIHTAIQWASIVVIAVGTPQDQNGNADLSAVYSVADQIARSLNGYKIIITKSTVPMGTNHTIKLLIQKLNKYGHDFDVVSNPEFLQEGRVWQGVIEPDRIVLGTEHQRPVEALSNLYKQYHEKGVSIIYTNFQTAEMIKYCSNSFLATKVAFINEMARLAEVVDVDVREVAKGMGLDPRIGEKYLHPGPGFGGSCLPKDVRALDTMASERGLHLKLLSAITESNDTHKRYIVDKVLRHFNSENLNGRILAILGIAFKADTDDIRESPAVDIVDRLLEAGAVIQVFDPKAMEKGKLLWNHKVEFCQSELIAMTNADMTLILTEWQSFKSISLIQAKQVMRGSTFFDARGIFERNFVEAAGLDYLGIGY